ncbi:polymorphic toxin-type HINT domain-containing protein [Acetivibrio clariflavus]|uniref:polymorphic toxin-type HINT domain-containing protein n=1 Tax=Acetivibrio clariflavus TaxID=288965 RepID=UPI0004AEA4D7|nr:polymorphic toxin-type HINT domain-containing protein [Acetivibrio clariflavus]
MMGPQWEFQYANTTVNLEVIDVVHRFLDLGGMIPVFGTLFDGTNAILYFVEGDMVNWCLSMLGTIELIQYGCAGLKIAAKALKATDKMMLGKNSLKVATDSIGLIKAGKANMLDDIASITRTQKGYEFVTTDGIIFKMIDDDIPAAAKSVVKSMSDSTDELMTCLKREPEALFELVEETKELDNTILYRLRDDTEIQLFKSDLTPEQIICSTIGCFTGDTLVTTKEGLKRIDEVKTGDYVLSKDVKSGEIGYKKVNYVYIKNTNRLVQLIVGNEEINTTSSHLFFTDSGWCKSAKNITVGDRILTADGELKEVTATRVVELEEAIRIYNLNVDEFHTYFVGTSGLLVHNDCTAEMMAAGRNAITYAKKRDIADPRVLSDIASTTAFSVQWAIREGITDSTELARIGEETATAVIETVKRVGPEVASSVEANALDAHEYIQALEIAEFRPGKRFIGNTVWDAPGIDGTLNGVYVSLKKYSGGSVAGVLKYASEAETKAAAAGYRAIDVYIDAKGVPTLNLIDYANTPPANLSKITTQGIISNIYVNTSGGWVKITNGIAELVQ